MIPVVTTLVLVATFAGTATADEAEPYVVTNEWNGFIECGIGTAGAAVALCSVLERPNDDFIEEGTLGPGIETVVIGMRWAPVGGISDSELELIVDAGHTEVRISGPSPLEVRIDDVPSEGGDLRFRVFASTDTAALVYHQQFTVYHDHFYHEAAPEGYSALPDF